MALGIWPAEAGADARQILLRRSPPQDDVIISVKSLRMMSCSCKPLQDDHILGLAVSGQRPIFVKRRTGAKC